MKILLHVCCAPCATHSIETLQAEYEVTLFFADSNISPENEYRRRLAEARRLAAAYGCAFAEDPYDHEAWLASVAGLEDEPEKGRRCLKCFEFNLTRAAEFAGSHGFAAFTTSLTISPHKRSADIFEIARRLGNFLPIDFKKKDGFKHSLELSREHALYRQDYCGCEFSRRGG